jgi:two-component system sensor histidine kinase HydH
MKRLLPAAAIGGAVLFISLLHFLTPIDSLILHQIYQRLYYIPIILSAFWFGWRGGLGAAALVCLSYVPHIALHWQHQNHDYALNQYFEIALFFLIGAVTGWLGDQKRREHERAERIKAELQTAYSELRRTVDQLLQAERLSSLAEIASTVVHEIRNPLASIKGAVEILEDELPTSSPRREFAQIAKTEVARIDKLVQEFFHSARAKEPNREPTDPNTVVHAVSLLIEKQAKQQGVSIIEELPDDVGIAYLDGEQIKQVLLNLAINSLHAMPAGGRLIFRTLRDGSDLHIQTEDTGGGIPDNIKSKIFDPFFTTKDKGLGLGLSVAHKIVTRHGGRIDVTDTGDGARFSLIFPLMIANG